MARSKKSQEDAPPRPEALALAYYNHAAVALDILYEAALVSEGALEELRGEAERLVKRGAQWRDAKYALKRGKPR